MLTAGHHLPLQLVPGQVEHPEDRIVQEDQEQHEEEVPDEVEACQDVKNLLPQGQEHGAWGGRDGQEDAPQFSHPADPSPWTDLSPGWSRGLCAHLGGVAAVRTPGQGRKHSSRAGAPRLQGEA